MKTPIIDIRAVIFDMDGLLINSEPFWQEAEKIVFKNVGIKLTTEMCHTTVGLRIDEVVNHWFQKFLWEGISKKEIENRVVDKVIEFVNTKGQPMPGVFHALDFFRKREIQWRLLQPPISN